MRLLVSFIICFGLLAAALADAPTHTTSKRDRKKAQKEYVAAMDALRAGDIGSAKELLERSLALDPANIAAITARELVRQNDVHQEISEARRDLQSKQEAKAIAGFRKALAVDPSNLAAQQGLSATLAQNAADNAGRPEVRYQDAEDIRIQPRDAPHDFHFKGDSRGLLEQVWNAYGIRPLIDSSVNSKQLRFDIDGANFATAITISGQMTKTFYVPVSVNQALIFADTPENRRNFERLALRTFYIGEASTPQEINDTVTMLRTIFDLRFVTPAAASNQITVRAPIEMLNAVTRILEDLYSGAPQVMLELNVYQVE
ncbi:MAG TPA: hypothetical protein VFE08_13000, partial [Candidatus Sulfotelmatobacter sp.]|nr:hypothetical protein [Candidatus Sulfotelmatobacter sp.]